MFLFTSLKSLHLEISSVCQASCPMCIRNINGGMVNDRFTPTSWTLENYKKILTEDIISQLDTITLCGNLGDPISNDNIMDMIQYTSSINSKIYFSIHTNGSIRNANWWRSFAKVLPFNHNVVFALDGLKDTLSIYRIGTYFDKIIENAKAFIDAGGNAEWAFIVFKHNQHQIEQARDLSKVLGFKTFQIKNSTRFVGEPKVRVVSKIGEPIYDIEPADSVQLKYIDYSVISNYKEIVNNAKIDCVVKKEKSIYIDHRGDVYPCCWVGAVPYTWQNTQDGAQSVRKEMYREHLELLNDLNGPESINAIFRPLKDIINDSRWQEIWDKIWLEKRSIVCARTCGSVDFSQPKDQFKDRYQFDGK
jgi:MoaA/NifB/PqqE/SkfB family radical SAM enzyme